MYEKGSSSNIHNVKKETPETEVEESEKENSDDSVPFMAGRPRSVSSFSLASQDVIHHSGSNDFIYIVRQQ